jgi:FkbM family methyltransferase
MRDPQHEFTTPRNSGHGQFAEDLLLQRYFGDRIKGVCLEVGAFDGVTGSATLAFEQRGWETILVEPVSSLAAKIRSHRRGKLFEVAAGPVDGTAVLKVARNDKAISTVANSKDQQQFYALRRESWDEIEVIQRTLDSILSEAGVSKVDFATIDVEGFELEVLRGWSLARWRPRILIVEDNSRGLDLAVPNYLSAQGYTCFHHKGVNDWYARIEDTELATPVAHLRQWARRRIRSIRQGIKHVAPASAIRLARRCGVAGE